MAVGTARMSWVVHGPGTGDSLGDRPPAGLLRRAAARGIRAWRRSQRGQFARWTAVLLGLLSASPADAQARLKVYKTQYYDIHTDLGPDVVREASLRSDLMVREYMARTRGFSRQLRARLPLYLFSNPRDYYAAGAIPGSTGTFRVDEDGDARLMVLAGSEASAQTWSTMQHEGFHQFVHAVIGTGLPIWANEGLAEYFGEGLFTGDDYITGVVHPGRLEQLRQMLASKQTHPMLEMMRTKPTDWNAHLSGVNYLQAWSMVHFLAHADPRYQQAFDGFLREVARGLPWENAWKQAFGADIGAFEKRWREYWEKLDSMKATETYRKAVVLTMTSHYARALSQGQRFGSPEEFFQAARQGKLQAHSKDWLPPSLMARDLPVVTLVGEWSIDPRRSNALTCQTDGARLTGVFEIAGGRVRPGSVRLLAAASSARK
jgi:hypothetical protein